jgi:hypothetical protein
LIDHSGAVAASIQGHFASQQESSVFPKGGR